MPKFSRMYPYQLGRLAFNCDAPILIGMYPQLNWMHPDEMRYILINWDVPLLIGMYLN